MPADDPESPLASFGRAVGVVSLGLAAVGVLRPRALAAAGGVRTAGEDAALPVLVRLAAARQASLGLALLTRRPLDMQRAAGLFLPTTVVDAVAVLVGAHQGVLARRSAVMSLAVLAANAWVSRAARAAADDRR